MEVSANILNNEEEGCQKIITYILDAYSLLFVVCNSEYYFKTLR